MKIVKASITKATCIFILALSTLLVPSAEGQGLNGATGSVFKVNPEQRSFELLKETEYDPRTDIGRSRFTVYWNDQTRLTKVTERANFDGIAGPVMADFGGLDEKNIKALSVGMPFVAPKVSLLPGDQNAAGFSAERRQVVGWFTPDSGPSARSGSVQVNGKPVKVSVKGAKSRIEVREAFKSDDLGKGLWKATLRGAESEGRFLITSMEVQPLEDPRKTDDPKLPRVLVVGDSISMNYHEAAKRALGGVANYHRNEGNASSTVAGVANMELWLGEYKERGLHWDVIQFNHGLHDLKQTYDAATDTFGAHSVPLEDYKRNLEKEISILKKTGAKLIWCSTTPVPNDNKGTYARHKGAELDFNRAALEVMKLHPEILVTDLHQVIDASPLFDNWRRGNDVHFNRADEQTLLGEAVAATIRKALSPPAGN